MDRLQVLNLQRVSSREGSVLRPMLGRAHSPSVAPLRNRSLAQKLQDQLRRHSFVLRVQVVLQVRKGVPRDTKKARAAGAAAVSDIVAGGIVGNFGQIPKSHASIFSSMYSKDAAVSNQARSPFVASPEKFTHMPLIPPLSQTMSTLSFPRVRNMFWIVLAFQYHHMHRLHQYLCVIWPWQSSFMNQPRSIVVIHVVSYHHVGIHLIVTLYLQFRVFYIKNFVRYHVFHIVVITVVRILTPSCGLKITVPELQYVMQTRILAGSLLARIGLSLQYKV